MVAEIIVAWKIICGAVYGLEPTSQGKRVAFDGAGRKVISGPFAPTREQIAGFWVWEVKDLDQGRQPGQARYGPRQWPPGPVMRYKS